LHEFADLLDDADRDLAGAPASGSEFANAFDDLADLFIDWGDDQKPALARARIVEPHLAHYAGLSPDGRGEFAEFYRAKKTDTTSGQLHPDALDPMDDEVWATLEHQLDLEVIKTWQRMIEAGGTAANGLWFEEAREFYVPDSNRPGGNFLIDTFDMTEVVTPAAWAALDESFKVDVDQRLPSDSVAEAMLVNEVQIELALEKPYLARINALQAKIDDGTATDQDRRNLDGAQFVFDTLLDAQVRIAEAKEEHIIDVLEDNRVPDNTLEWGPVEMSKGDRALKLVRGQG
jgi:hypothetical protein